MQNLGPGGGQSEIFQNWGGGGGQWYEGVELV